MSNTQIPESQIIDAHKLDADGYVPLFRIYPLVGGQVDIKNGPEVTYLGVEYESLPVKLSGEKWTSDESIPNPRLVVGQPDLDLLPFKGLIHDGYLDGATVIRYQVLLEDLLADVDSKRITHFKIKRVESYGRLQISFLLSSYSGASRQNYPFRQYTPPAFPWVNL
jgi:phage-related protein